MRLDGQGKAWLLGGATALAGVALAVVLHGVLRTPEPVAPTVPASVPAAPAPTNVPPPAAQTVPTDAPVDVAVADAPAAVGPEAVAPQGPETPGAAADDSGPAPAAPPAFDVVRVAEDGGALVAGAAPVGAMVVLRVDEAPVARVEADATGQFVAIFWLDPSETVQVLTLEAELPGGEVVRAEDVVVLTPRRAPALAAPALVTDPTPAEATPTPAEATIAEAPAPDDGFEPSSVEMIAALPEPVAVETPETLAADETAAAASTAEEPAAEAVAEPAPAAASGIPALTSATPQPAPAPTAPDPGEGPALADAGDADNALPRAFLIGRDGAVRVLDQAPQVMDNVVIDAIAYSAQGDVQISGRAARGDDGASLRIYLDNRPVAVARADDGDWNTDLPDVDPGIYTLRVDQLNPEGRVISRFETPFQREDPQIVAMAQARATGSSAARSAEAAPIPDTGAEQAPAEPVAAPVAASPDALAPVTGPVSAPVTIPAVAPADTATAGPVPVAPSPETVAMADEPAALESQAAQSPAPVVTPADETPVAPMTPVAPATEVAAASPAPAAPAPAAPVPDAPVPDAGSPRVVLVTVQPGQSLWRISREHYGAGQQYVVIYRANRSQIRNPDLIYPGQVFVLPE